MNLHEYQTKMILEKYDIPIPPFRVASCQEELIQAADEMGSDQFVIKIQVHAGGRGKAGGVKFAKSKKEALHIAKELIGMKMVNEQTGPEGIIARQVLLSVPLEIDHEFYLGAVIDRDRATPLLIASPEGGMDIEEVAKTHPEKILKMPFSSDGKLRSYQKLRLAKIMGWSKEVAKQGIALAENLARCFIEKDASLLEINPLVLSDNRLFALDAKLSIDDNALFRQRQIVSFYDPTQLSQQEAASKEFDLAYIAMHGTIGCMVNGAGLAMATMDIIELEGGSAANFLDVGGSASKEKVAEGFRIILSDPNVKAILVNIFGGIMNCATLAEGVILACLEQKIKVPIVVRMEGTNVEEGKRLFQKSGLKIHTAEDLQKAAKLAVEMGRG